MWQQVNEWMVTLRLSVALIALVGAPLQSHAERSLEETADKAAANGVDTSLVVSRPSPGLQDAARNHANWVTLLGEGEAKGFVDTNGYIRFCGAVRLDPITGNLIAECGEGVIAALSKLDYNEDNNLVSKESFADCEVSLEFFLGKGANSGVKLQERYEIQLYDSHGVDEPSATDCGGVYPHWKFRRNGKELYYIDAGVPPKANASRPAGEWQQLQIVFRAPRFDQEDEKIENAMFRLVTLNGQVVHRNVELTSPTGNVSNPLAEVSQAPLYLQLDHGPVAFRNVRVRQLKE